MTSKLNSYELLVSPKRSVPMRLLGLITVILACTLTPEHGAVLAAQPAEDSFAATIKPILARRCFACHGPDVENGGLRLHKGEMALAELDSGGRAIVPGNPDASLLLRACRQKTKANACRRKASHLRRKKSKLCALGLRKAPNGRSIGRSYHPRPTRRRQ